MNKAWVKKYSETDLSEYETIEFESEQECCLSCDEDRELGFFDFETSCCCRHYAEYKERHL